MTLSYLSLAVAAVISVRTSVSVHRYLGFGAMAASGAAVNYFLMEPVHSFRISQIGDLTALGFYSLLGMFVALYQTASVRHAVALAVPRFQPVRRSPGESADLLDAYHFNLLVQLCADIGRMRGTSVDLRVVLNIALKRLGVDSERSSREILEDVQRQLEYEAWIASQLSGEKLSSPEDGR